MRLSLISALLLLLLRGLRSGAISLIESPSSRDYHFGIQHTDSQGNSSYKFFRNADFSESVDDVGQFSFWSNAFITVNPGEMFAFPSNVQAKIVAETNLPLPTFLVSANVFGDETIARLVPIPSLRKTYICFRGYTKDGKVHGELSLRRPDRELVLDQIIEKTSLGGLQKFSKNQYGAMVSVWSCEKGDFFKIAKGSLSVNAFLQDGILANAACYGKDFVGNLYVTHERCGISYSESPFEYI